MGISYFWVCVNFGLITIVVALFFDWMVSGVLKIKRNIPSWTLWKWIVYMFILLIMISLANYVYYLRLNELDTGSWSSFLEIAITTILIGLFPVVFSGLIVQINAIKRNQIQANYLQNNFPKKETQKKIIEINSNNKNQNFSAPINDIYYMESMQNYVSIFFKKDDEFKKELVRNTLKNIEAQLGTSPLIRCHRSFIVNKELIENVDGNAQGLNLKLKDLEDFVVPVSRKYIPILREK